MEGFFSSINWKQIAADPIFAFIFTTGLSLLGLILSLNFYYRSKSIVSSRFLSKRFAHEGGLRNPDFELRFRGRKVERIFFEHLIYWNSGNQTFKQSDFAKLNQLRLSIPPGVVVHDLNIVATTSHDNAVALSTSGKNLDLREQDVQINFDYLDPGDGFTIEIVYEASERARVEILGKIPSTQGIQRHYTNHYEEMLPPKGLAFVRGFWVMVAIGWGAYDFYSSGFRWYHAILILIILAALAFAPLLPTEHSVPEKLYVQ